MKQTVVPPDIFRLRHRQALSQVVAAIVHQGTPATPETIRAQLPSNVAQADVEAFVALVMAEFKSLHPGNAVRFGIRPLEFEAWQGSRVFKS